MSTVLDAATLDQLFREARSHNGFLPNKPVEDSQLRALYDLVKWGPTSVNMSPSRLVFVKSPEAKKILAPALAEGNVEKTMGAPVTIILGQDEDFHEKLPFLFPHADVKAWFEGPRENRRITALQNATLQGAYIILAARALGLDTGPMTGFDNAKVDELFFAGTTIKSSLLINLGYGDTSKLFPRTPRFAFEDIAKIL